ncbi:hypothetical protein EVAR_50615_1 [Eumeta japonica]|uniref:Uncharacterized protein n=1 Tax=Eumeta variegata TaxID=151549 RepID=A0A4C1Y9D7_EUMVA|nr:hypothetical protein EVAR_50615_1 [Eumeta japonica]
MNLVYEGRSQLGINPWSIAALCRRVVGYDLYADCATSIVGRDFEGYKGATKSASTNDVRDGLRLLTDPEREP